MKQSKYLKTPDNPRTADQAAAPCCAEHESRAPVGGPLRAARCDARLLRTQRLFPRKPSITAMMFDWSTMIPGDARRLHFSYLTLIWQLRTKLDEQEPGCRIRLPSHLGETY